MALLDEPQGFNDESSVSAQPVILKWTAISAAISIIFSLLSTMFGLMAKGLMSSILAWLVMIAIGIVIYVFAIREHRDQQLGGFISFKRVFVVVLAIMLLSSLIAQIFSYLYFNYINPSAAEQVADSMRELFESFNMPEDKMEEALTKMVDDLKSPFTIVKGLLGSAVIGSIIAVIMAAIMKKERPIFG
jgi:beta-lactamase regulating signal transducer with metallopeptidase domain